VELSERRVGGVTVVDVAGNLTLTDGAGRLKDKITSLVFQGDKQIVLNLGKLSYMDSAGLGEMVACHTTALRGGASVRLANIGRKIQDLLVMTKLLTVFDSHENEADAVASFNQPK